MSTAADPIATTIRRRRARVGGGLPSVCSAGADASVPDPGIAVAEKGVLANLDRTGVPLPLLSQVLSDQDRRVRRSELAPDLRQLVLATVRNALRTDAAACRPLPNGASS